MAYGPMCTARCFESSGNKAREANYNRSAQRGELRKSNYPSADIVCCNGTNLGNQSAGRDVRVVRSRRRDCRPTNATHRCRAMSARVPRRVTTSRKKTTRRCARSYRTETDANHPFRKIGRQSTRQSSRSGGTALFGTSTNAEQHRARERALRWRQRIEKSERQPARPAHVRQVVAENADEPMRERDAGPTDRFGAAARSARASPIADRFAWHVGHRPRELVGVAQPDVECPGRRPDAASARRCRRRRCAWP